MPVQTTITFAETSLDAGRVIRASQEEREVPVLGDSEVAVQFLASPINPQDLLVIAGRYPLKPNHEHNGQPIPGYDGVCRVTQAGRNVTTLKPGDHAVPLRHGLGTWRSHAVVDADALVRVPGELDPVAASLLKMGALVAWLLLRERTQLCPGDWIVQNAAGSVIAQIVSQVARNQGLHCLSVIRDRDDVEPLRRALTDVGASAVVTESELKACRGQLPCLAGRRVVLALDSVFGGSGKRLVDLLTQGATYVNYGSLGGVDKELRLSQQDLFWKRITFKNFRLSDALRAYSSDEFKDILAWLAQCFIQKQLEVPPVEISRVGGGDVESLAQFVLTRAANKDIVGVKKQVFHFAD